LSAKANVPEAKMKQHVFRVETNRALDGGKARDLYLKQSLIGLCVSQKLPDIRLGTEVFATLKKVVNNNSGYFTPEEDKLVLEWGRKGGKMSELDDKLGRVLNSCYHRHRLLVAREKEHQKGSFLPWEDEHIIKTVMKYSEVENTSLADFPWDKFTMKRTRNSIRNRWIYILQPAILQYKAGTMDVNVKSKLLSVITSKGWQYSQWKPWKSYMAKGATSFTEVRMAVNVRTNLRIIQF